MIFSKEYPKSCIVNANPVDCLKVCFNDMIRIMPDSLPGPLLILRYLICPILTYLVCAAIYNIMRLVMPKTLSILCGGRV